MSADPFGFGLDTKKTDEHGVLTLTLPWPPSTNAFKIPHPKVRGMYFLTARAKKFREDVGWLCAGSSKFGADEIELDIVLHAPDKRRRDADNFIKAVWDALQSARVFDDDCQVQSYKVTKGAVVMGGAVVVKIWRIRAQHSIRG